MTVKNSEIGSNALITFVILMTYLSEGDLLTKDTLDPNRTNIKSRTGDPKGWLKKDTLQPNRINVYDKYGNKKGWLEKDTLNQDAWKFREN